jgi:hypothetical protein
MQVAASITRFLLKFAPRSRLGLFTGLGMAARKDPDAWVLNSGYLIPPLQQGRAIVSQKDDCADGALESHERPPGPTKAAVAASMVCLMPVGMGVAANWGNALASPVKSKWR